MRRFSDGITKRLSRAAIVVLCSAGASACDPLDAVVKPSVEQHLAQANVDNAKTILAIRAEHAKSITSLSEQIKKLEAENNDLRSKVATLEFSDTVTNSILETIESKAATVSDGDGYGVARTPQGPVIISIEKVQPYLDGYKVSLRVGNLTTASMNGAELEVEWGLQYGTKNTTYAQVFASKKKKRFSSAVPFPSGAYTLFDVILTPATPDEVKTISVTPHWNRLSLRTPAPRIGQ